MTGPRRYLAEYEMYRPEFESEAYGVGRGLSAAMHNWQAATERVAA